MPLSLRIRTNEAKSIAKSIAAKIRATVEFNIPLVTRTFNNAKVNDTSMINKPNSVAVRSCQIIAHVSAQLAMVFSGFLNIIQTPPVRLDAPPNQNLT